MTNDELNAINALYESGMIDADEAKYMRRYLMDMAA